MTFRRGVLVVGKIALATACGGLTSRQAAARSAEPTPRPPPTIQGTWQPTQLAGYTGPLDPTAHPASPVVSFAHLTWSGSDGCNRISGTFTFRMGAGFHAVPGVSTQIGCRNVSNTEVLRAATRARIIGRATLVFTAADGHELGRYTRSAAPGLDDSGACRRGKPRLVVTLQLVHDPPSGTPPRPLPGTAIAFRVNRGGQCAFVIGRSGTARVGLSPGSYFVYGVSPRYGRGVLQCQTAIHGQPVTIVVPKRGSARPKHLRLLCPQTPYGP